MNIINANALHIPLPDGCVQTVVTSPPYWGLRDYGVSNQLGLEKTPDCLGWATGKPCGECYVCHMVAVFREVRRVMREDATLWLNLGDSYAGAGDRSNGGKGYEHNQGKQFKTPDVEIGLKPKDLIGIPWRVALALQADGWWLRSDIIWSKPNPMPESVTDRPTKAHEYVFLMTKAARYFWDQEAVKEQAVNGDPTSPRGSNGASSPNSGRRKQDEVNNRRYTGFNERWDNKEEPLTTRNLRTVWEIATQPTSEAHFATYPEALVERCIKAGTSAHGCCPKCGKAWERVVEHKSIPARPGTHTKREGQELEIQGVNKRFRLIPEITTLGFRPSCSCPPADPIPCLVFDPFTGSGTTGRVAIKLGRRFVGTELKFDYIHEIARRRTANLQPIMFAEAQ